MRSINSRASASSSGELPGSTQSNPSKGSLETVRPRERGMTHPLDVQLLHDLYEKCEWVASRRFSSFAVTQAEPQIGE